MTDDEWEAIAMLLEHGWAWPAEEGFDDDKRDTFRTFLDPYPAKAVMDALHRLAGTGKPFVKVPELVKAVKDVAIPPTPPWAEVWPLLRRAMKRAGRPPIGKGVEAALAWLREQHPVAAAFAEREDLERLKMVEYDDPDYGPLRVRELRERWEEFVGYAQERLDRGLAIESGNRRQLGPRSFDPLAALGLERPREIGTGEP